MNFGYARVSTKDQIMDRQIDQLMLKGIHRANIYCDVITGKKKDRPKLNELLKIIDAGDVIIVTELARLGRSTKDLIKIAEELNEKSVELVSLKESLDTTTATGKMLFTLFSMLAQFEADMISERTIEGLKSARARGRLGGRKPVDQTMLHNAYSVYKTGQMPVVDICKTFKIGKTTLYRYIKERDGESSGKHDKSSN